MKVQINDLTQQFEQQKSQLTVLDKITFDVEDGQFVALIGPSGCGKSSLLRLLCGLATPTSGTIMLGDATPQQVASEKGIAWMSQQPALLPWRSVYANIALAHQVNPQPEQLRYTTVESLINLIGLQEFSNSYPHTLSGGMQQRVMLARTLALEAQLWLMDEPFAALDQLTREQLVNEVLRYWQRAQPTVLWVTHQIQEAVLMADRVLVMSFCPARIVADVAVNLSRPREDTSQEFQILVRCLRQAIADGM
ncbi:MAG: ABC transporter ATP-binding protein [Chloroflexota bacterium]